MADVKLRIVFILAAAFVLSGCFTKKEPMPADHWPGNWGGPDDEALRLYADGQIVYTVEKAFVIASGRFSRDGEDTIEINFTAFDNNREMSHQVPRKATVKLQESKKAFEFNRKLYKRGEN